MDVGNDIDTHIVLQELEFNMTVGVQAFGGHAGQMAHEGIHKRLGPFLEFREQLIANAIGIHHVGVWMCMGRIQSRHQRGR